MNLRGFPSKLIALIFLCLMFKAPIFPSQEAPLWKFTPQKKTLPNGLEIIYHKDDSSAITVLHFVAKSGKTAQSEGKEGLAYLTTRLLLEIPDWKKAQELMIKGSRFSMLCKEDYSRINLASLSENLEDTLKIYSKIILKPLISGLRISKIKEQMVHQKERESDDLNALGHQAHMEKLFANTVVGSSTLGSEESHKKIKKKDIENFYKDNFHAKNIFIVVCTDLEQEILMPMLQKYFGKLPSKETVEIGLINCSIPEERESFIEKDTEQSLVSIAFPLPTLNPKNFILAFMLENLLGVGVGSKLWPLREEKKLAYVVNARATHMNSGGILEVYLETENSKREVARKELKKILVDLFESGLGEDELKTTKILSKSYFLRGIETKEIRAQNFDFFEASGLGIDFANQILVEIDKISLEEIEAYIKEVLDPERYVEVIVGPKEAQNSGS